MQALKKTPFWKCPFCGKKHSFYGLETNHFRIKAFVSFVSRAVIFVFPLLVLLNIFSFKKMMKQIVVFIALVIALSSAVNWQVDVGHGIGTGVSEVPSEWAVLRFFPNNITINVGDTITWTHRSDGHTVTFFPSVLQTFSDPQNLFIDPAVFPIPSGKGNSTDNAAEITSKTEKYSSGLLAVVGTTWTAKFPTVGVFFYFCLLHPGQVGYVNVLPGGQTAGVSTQEEINTQRGNADLICYAIRFPTF